MSSRQQAVAGSFYPSNCNEVETYIEQFNDMLDDEIFKKSTITPRALIVPHAGYVYSGFTANPVYNIAAKRDDIKRIVVIGPSHRVAFSGASVALYDHYETPCGSLEIDLNYANVLHDRFEWIGFAQQMHHEHSTEVQMPLIWNYFSAVPVVEIVYGRMDPNALALSIEYMMRDAHNLVVISTDLSHFYTLEEAHYRDKVCLKAIESMNVSMLNEGCEACGMIGVKGVLLSAKNLGFSTQIVDYRTSADASGDKSRVVGYVSVLIG